MDVFRNKSFKKNILLISGLVLTAAISVFFFSPVSSIIVIVMGILILTLLWLDAKKRYGEMEHLSRELDAILHGSDRNLITECEEGELAILSSSIRKMTIKLKEQASLLMDE